MPSNRRDTPLLRRLGKAAFLKALLSGLREVHNPHLQEFADIIDPDLGTPFRVVIVRSVGLSVRDLSIYWQVRAAIKRQTVTNGKVKNAITEVAGAEGLNVETVRKIYQKISRLKRGGWTVVADADLDLLLPEEREGLEELLDEEAELRAEQEEGLPRRGRPRKVDLD